MLVAILNSPTGAGEPVQTDWGRAQVTVRQEDGRWIIAGQRHTAIVHPDMLALQVKDQSVTWGLEGSTDGDLLVERKGQSMSLRLAVAKKVDVTFYDTGFMARVKIALSGYRHDDTPLDLRMRLFVKLIVNDAQRGPAGPTGRELHPSEGGCDHSESLRKGGQFARGGPGQGSGYPHHQRKLRDALRAHGLCRLQ